MKYNSGTVNLWLLLKCSSEKKLSWDASHWVIQHDILAGQLQQHGVVEELVDGDVLGQTLPPPRLHHELTRLNISINVILERDQVSVSGYLSICTTRSKVCESLWRNCISCAAQFLKRLDRTCFSDPQTYKLGLSKLSQILIVQLFDNELKVDLPSDTEHIAIKNEVSSGVPIICNKCSCNVVKQG